LNMNKIKNNQHTPLLRYSVQPITLAICRGEGKLFAALIAMTVMSNRNFMFSKKKDNEPTLPDVSKNF
jgi:hypothetical protein